MKAQKDVNVKDELELPYRQELYRGFLLYCLSGDVVTLPLGAQIVIDRDESEFVRLAQLGDILGLTPADVSGVHKGLAEQASVKAARALALSCSSFSSTFSIVLLSQITRAGDSVTAYGRVKSAALLFRIQALQLAC